MTPKNIDTLIEYSQYKNIVPSHLHQIILDATFETIDHIIDTLYDNQEILERSNLSYSPYLACWKKAELLTFSDDYDQWILYITEDLRLPDFPANYNVEIHFFLAFCYLQMGDVHACLNVFEDMEKIARENAVDLSQVEYPYFVSRALVEGIYEVRNNNSLQV